MLAALIALMLLAPAGPAQSHPGLLRAAAQADETEQMNFTYGVDRSSWYWEHQVDEELNAADLSQRVSLPNPQAPETLPVAVDAGEPAKLSALRFDLVERGVPEGSTVTRFVLTIVEGTSPGDTMPTLNPLEHEVQACRADSDWSPGEADLWDAQPEAAECVTGERAEGDLDDEELSATWTFDLSTMAAAWGEDTFGNHGVLLAPVVPEDADVTHTWQVNLLLPQRNDPNTPADEYEETADRVSVEMDYLPGEPDPTDESDPVDSAAPPPPASSGGSSGQGASGGVPDPGAPPEIDDAAGAETEPAPVDQEMTAAPFAPRMPWYVWLLLPVALLGAALVRGALVEAPAATRPGGVMEAIRQRNLLRRGGVLPVPAGGLGRLRATFSGTRRRGLSA